MKELGKHDFHGNCMPGECANYGEFQHTVSVGCFEWIRGKCKSLKRGKAKVRVSGPIHMTDQIQAKAREICDQLDAGTYTGTKNAKVK